MNRPSYKFAVIDESQKNEEKGKISWTHKCGTQLIGQTAHLTVRDGLFPLSGSGEVESITVPYCPNCEDVPRTHGVIYPDGRVEHPSFVLDTGTDQSVPS
ncbi:MAG: hypothetical protein H6799_01025 [Candidatus Nomurabacteria bacterium]|nr:MAG: hypothetical protein H6799_01025 [Candidatus Nomurabacteria bacterium]